MATAIPLDSPTDDSADGSTGGWRSAWPDGLAFIVWLAVAWYSGWNTTDLVWSLWLSSLVVGYAMIVWSVARPGLDVARALHRGRAIIAPTASGASGAPPAAAVAGLMAFGALFVLAFFTIHFGGFHYVHSQFLLAFFPIDGETGQRGLAGLSTYAEVFRRYWGFLPAAFIAERGAFLRPAADTAPDVSVTAAAIAARTRANARRPMSGMTAPYRNVMRMHALIFFFAFAHFARLENFAVYAVVYTVYFFPWRLVRRTGNGTSASAVSA